MDVNRKPEIRFSVLKPKTGSISLATSFRIYFFSFLLTNLSKNVQMSDKIDSHVCLMFSVYEIFIKRSNIATKEIIYYKI